ncbi:hypothetical protein FGG08_004351 [Glutinoglossum americanum]|uniref:DUF3752 domain-containing protein n=1 Tax=Glutinoglossum americanum TaxID=1670608 RepID=A0A9P8KZN5_9PEZI|nr:hypothetical protein FGG08_004351 [Glutinoglossum americanum]
MSTSGPELPPHLLAKRKRREEEEEAARVSSNTSSNSRGSRPNSSDSAEKRQRVIGPALPPTALEGKPIGAPGNIGEEDSTSDDEIGPSLPSGSGYTGHSEAQQKMAQLEAIARGEAKKPKREEWMLVPPKDEDWSSRVDPTKLRNRKFNTGKGAKAPTHKSGGVSSIWTETPEEKRQRLADEVMGVRKPAAEEHPVTIKPVQDEDTARRIREYNKPLRQEKNRNKSLYEEHKKATPREKEDDPSKRAFDKEKDIGGRKIGYNQKKEMLTRAADFGSRFSSGSFL